MSNSPFDATLDILKPHAPPEIPSPFAAADATKTLSPFSEPQDVDSIISQLKLDRPLSLFIPNRELYPEWEFHIINSIPKEIADAHNKGFKEVDDPKLNATFRELVAGTDRDGKAFRPILCARPKKVGEHIRRQQRMQLRSLYAGMDPRNKEFQSKYADSVGKKDGTFLDRTGDGWRIRV